MKTYLLRLALSLSVLALVFCLAGCQAQPAEIERLIRVVEQAVSDGVVTEAELALIQGSLPQQSDWMSVVLPIVSIAGSLLGVKLLPTRMLQGPFDAAPRSGSAPSVSA